MQSGSKGEQLPKIKFIHHIEATSLEYLRCKNKLGCEKFWLILARTPYSSQARLPPPPNQTLPLFQMKNWSGLRTLSFRLVLSWAKYPPPPKMKIWSGLGSFRLVLGWQNTLPPPMTYVERAGVWRLIAVSPKDTVYFFLQFTEHCNTRSWINTIQIAISPTCRT